MTEKLCPTCGKHFELPPNRPNQKYCSMDCSVQGKLADKENEAYKRVKKFMDNRGTYNVIDVLEGRMGLGSTDNRMIVKGARHWKNEGKQFIILVVD